MAAAAAEGSSDAPAEDRPERASPASKKSKPASTHAGAPRSKAPVTKVDNAGF
jgi:hypothetical protein